MAVLRPFTLKYKIEKITLASIETLQQFEVRATTQQRFRLPASPAPVATKLYAAQVTQLLLTGKLYVMSTTQYL
ncbi:hypothetical protein RND71_012533 [Anisodus tanguticus]|uniref:Uncharacterized protein n=1 Tax=Anisodus tanguticus TaxID=243964 RepID=A0AAE1VLV1_9SOLA|nr:hypothetical protein RND71_012533 [Anisodus tanguticus]